MIGLGMLCVGCADETLTLQAGSTRLALDPAGRLLAVTRAAGTPLLETSTLAEPGGAVAARVTDYDVRLRAGHFGFRDRSRAPWIGASSAALRHVTARSVGLALRFEAAADDGADSPARRDGALDARVAAEGVFELRVAAPAGFDHTAISFVCHPDDQFLGLGAQTPSAHRGQVVAMWASEQGIGKADLVDHYAAYTPRGQTYDSYMPIPVLYNPRGYMVLVRGTRKVDFDFCKSDPARWRIEAWDKRLDIVVVTGDTPLQMLERMSEITGRPSLPPRWVFAPWVDAIKGQANVLALARMLRANDVPVSAIWTEDWAGAKDGFGGYHLTYQWSVDKAIYPDIKAMTSELHALGFRFLGYFNSFMSKGTPEWDNAHKRGLLVDDADGKPIIFAAPPSLGDTALLDLTKPAARTWASERMRAAIALGFDGWMADFAEWLPWNARLSDGRSGAEAHNDYPRMWQQLNRDVFRQARPDGDWVFFVRSGYTGTQAVAPVIWAGDQNTDFGQDDGLPTVPRIGLNLALSGVSYFGHDIAGYTSLYVDPPDKELYWRWTQLGAFSPVMRTHHGTTANGGHWFGDTQTPGALEHFARYARAHMQLVPYLYALARDSARRGWPMMRPMFVHYPELSATINDQYMLGDALLVAPVLARGVRARSVKLPAGIWYDYWTGERHIGGDDVEIAAPLDRIPVLARAGAIVPLLPPTVETVAPGPLGSNVVDHAATGGALVIRLFSGANGNFELADGGRITLESDATPSGALVARVGETRVTRGCDGDHVTKLPCVSIDRQRRSIELRIFGDSQIVSVDSDGRPAFRVRTALRASVPVTLRLQY